MEVFTLMIHRRVRDFELFTYHRYCSKLDLINLCFADDLFLFAHADANSAYVIMESLDEFKDASGLVPSLPKSTTYFYNILTHTKLAILHILPFEEGHLPVKYMGVPLISTRFVYRDCKELIEKVHNRLMRNGKAKVSWDVVCLPKKEGGMGIRKLDVFNKVIVISHIWSLLSHKESLWVRWIHACKIRGQIFWDVPVRGNMKWRWRKILQLRPILWQFVWYKLGTVRLFLLGLIVGAFQPSLGYYIFSGHPSCGLEFMHND
nr:hypothetical protein [Tanacetum cinerariifolium]